MKISKSFKTYIYILSAFFFMLQANSESTFPNNIIVHKNPIKISELKFKDINLQEIDLSNKKGNIMILNFWATWCVPCRKEMPSLEKLAQNYSNIKIYPINMEKPNKLRTRDFYNSIGVTSLDIYFDPKFSLVKKFKLRGMPTSIFIDKNGMEFARVLGEIDFVSKDFLKFLKKYI
jgi:thiol-disulfide isomerase/thioredoxin|tara:strand:- start:456 stop:983 length:528 start_codon:yes stop_codon:yes gene_type:complete